MTLDGSPAGVTLLELVVVLVILGLIISMSGVALATLRMPRGSVREGALRAARARAILGGHPVQVQVDSSPRQAEMSDRSTVRFLPDGRGIGWGVDPLTGEPVDTAR